MIEVTLTAVEMQFAAFVGEARHRENIENNRPNKYGASPEDALRLDINGARGECAVANYLGIYWNGNLGDYGAPDVGPYQVRAGGERHHSLILHPRDKDDDIFILPLGPAPTFEIVGWCHAREGKLPKYWKDPTKGNRWAYFYPRWLVHPIKDLPREPHKKWITTRPGFYQDRVRLLAAS